MGISTTQGGPLREPDGSNGDPDRFPPRPPQGGIPSGGSGGSIVPPAPPPPIPPPVAPAPEPPPPPPFIPFPEPPEPNLNEVVPPPPELPTSVVVAGVDIAALPASEIDLLLASGAVVAVSAKFVPLLLPLLPGVGLVALAAAGITVVYIYTDSIRELNVQAARQGVELNVGLVTTRLAVPPDEPLFLPLPGYELTDEFQNGIPVAIPEQIPE